MKKLALSFVFVMTLMLTMSVVLAAAPTPSNTIKDGLTAAKNTADGGKQMHVSNVFGLNHCVLKPMFDAEGQLTNQRSGWASFGPFWMKCNKFGPK